MRFYEFPENPSVSLKRKLRISGFVENLSEKIGECINRGEFIVEVMETELLEVEIERVRANANQPRKTFDKLQGLAQTIKKHGLIHPIEVDENYQIIVGERRWRAAKIAGLKKIMVTVRKGLSETDKLEHQLIEDIQDESIPILEKANAWQRLKNAKGMTNLELSKTIGVSERQVYRVLSLNNMPDVMVKALNEDRISATDLMEIRGLPAEEQMRVFKKTIESPGRKYLREQLKSYRRSLGRDVKARDFLRELGMQDSVNQNIIVAHHKGESMKHFIVKAMIYKILRELNRVTGCEMEVNSAMADLVDLSSRNVYEIESKVSSGRVKQKLAQFRSFNDVFIIDLAKLTDSLKEMEEYLREKIV